MLDHAGLGHVDRALFVTGIRELSPALGIDLGKTQVHETHRVVEKTELKQPVFGITDFENGQFVIQPAISTRGDTTSTGANCYSFCTEPGNIRSQGLPHQGMNSVASWTLRYIQQVQ